MKQTHVRNYLPSFRSLLTQIGQDRVPLMLAISFSSILVQYTCHLDYKSSSYLIPLLTIQVPPTADAPSTSIRVKCKLVKEAVGENKTEHMEHVQSAPQSDTEHIGSKTDAGIPTSVYPLLVLSVISI